MRRYLPQHYSARGSTKDEVALNTVKHWIEVCEISHDPCKKRPKTARQFLPTRLLDVSGDKIHLCRGTDLRLDQRYMTLSHCWGTSVPVTLQLANLVQFEHHIDLTQLPKTFQDAVQVTRALGISYLWIDSLCIIQDSIDDWYEQSRLMDHIYENGWCSIAATHAHNSSEGLFSNRNLLPYSSAGPLRVATHWMSADELSPVFLIEENPFFRHVGGSPLLKRAWVVQERVLSLRNIHYAQGQVFWECNTTTACECFATSLPDFSEATPTLKPRLEFSADPHPRSHSVDAWPRIVADYSNGRLTHPDKDTAVAIAGMARRIFQPQDYWIGLSKKDIHRHLCWRRDRSGNTVALSRCGAPTWSWMYLQAQITIPQYAYRCTLLYQNLEVKLLPKTDDVFGAMNAGATLTIEAPLCVTIVTDSTARTLSPYRNEFERRGSHMRGNGRHLHRRVPYQYSPSSLIVIDLDLEEPCDFEEVLCVLLHMSPLIEGRTRICGLIIARIDYGSRIFRRRGIVEVTISEESDGTTTTEQLDRFLYTLPEFMNDAAFAGRALRRHRELDVPLYRITLV